QLDSRVRHFVPVNGEPRAGQVGGAGQAHAAALGQFSKFLIPVRRFRHAANALCEVDGSQTQEVCGDGTRSLNDPKAQHGGGDLELVCDLVDLPLLAEAWLHRSMPALWSARRFVREGTATLKAIARDVIRRGLQGAGIKRAGNAVRAVGATV